MNRTTMILAAVMLCTGCATFTLIEPGRATVGDLYTVESPIAWSTWREGNMELWTVDGPALQSIRFVNGLADGKAWFSEKRKDGEKTPKFRKHMTASEIMEFVVDSITLQGGERVQATGLRPYKFGNAQGFRFEFSYVLQKGLEGQGVVVGAVVQDKLYLIVYSGTRAHYYPKYKDHVEHIIESIRMQSPNLTP